MYTDKGKKSILVLRINGMGLAILWRGCSFVPNASVDGGVLDLAVDNSRMHYFINRVTSQNCLAHICFNGQELTFYLTDIVLFV